MTTKESMTLARKLLGKMYPGQNYFDLTKEKYVKRVAAAIAELEKDGAIFLPPNDVRF